MTREDLARKVAAELGVAIPKGRQLVELIFREIRTAVENGEEVKIMHFGTFKPHLLKAKTYNVPGCEEVRTKDRIVMKFQRVRGSYCD